MNVNVHIDAINVYCGGSDGVRPKAFGENGAADIASTVSQRVKEVLLVRSEPSVVEAEEGR